MGADGYFLAGCGGDLDFSVRFDAIEALRRQLSLPEHADQLDRLKDKFDRIDRELQV